MQVLFDISKSGFLLSIHMNKPILQLKSNEETKCGKMWMRMHLGRIFNNVDPKQVVILSRIISDCIRICFKILTEPVLIPIFNK